MKKLFILFIAVVGLSVSSLAQSSESKTINATAKIIVPILVNKNGNIDFGSIVPGAAIGTVTIAADESATRSFGGGVTGVAATKTNSVFSVSGEPNTNYKITLSAATVTLTNASAPPMIATILCSQTITALSSAAIPIATSTFYIGATLAVGTALLQTAGTYDAAAPLGVTVAYE